MSDMSPMQMRLHLRQLQAENQYMAKALARSHVAVDVMGSILCAIAWSVATADHRDFGDFKYHFEAAVKEFERE